MASSTSRLTGSTTGSVSMYASTLDGSNVRLENFQDRIQQWRQWLYGKDLEGQTLSMGRTVKEWGIVILFYTIFLGSLIIMFITFMAVFFWVSDWNFPPMQGVASILDSPGMGFRPQTKVHTTTISFFKGDTTTYTDYIDQIEAYLRYYENENQQGENYIDCSSINGRRATDLDKVCRFDLLDLGPNCVKQQNYGYDDGRPCVLLKLNKVFDWIPEEYTNDTVPEAILPFWSQYWITVTCEGETATDRENIGYVAYWPPNGFHFKYFPFRNQQGYRSPLMFVHFQNPTPGVLLMVTCKAWARNIQHDTVDSVGLVHFEIIVD